MEVALRSRGMGDLLAPDIPSCYRDSGCRAISDITCYTTSYFDPGCKEWRAYNGQQPDTGIPLPPTIRPPVIDTNPTSPTYGQATVNGQVVASAEQAELLYRQQIAQAEADRKAQIMAVMTEQGRVNCAVLETDCGIFTSPNPSCTECIFDLGKPVVVLAIVAAMALLMAFRK